MNKILSTVALSALLSTGAVAGDIYGNIGAALTSVGAYDSGISIVATAGMKMDKVVPNFAVELEVAQTVVDPSYNWSGYSYKYTQDISVFSMGAYAVYNFKVPNTPITVKPRLGLSFENYTFEYDYNGNSRGGYEADYTDTSLSYGVGITYPFNEKLTAYVDYTDKGLSDNITVGVGMAF